MYRWLAISQWDLSLAIKRYINYEKFRRQRSEWFFKYPPQQYDSLLRLNHGCMLDGHDKKGRKVYYYTSANIDSDITSIDEQCILDSLWIESILDDAGQLKNGIAILIDMKV